MKLNVLKKYLNINFSLILSIVISLFLNILFIHLYTKQTNLNDFKIESFNMETETTQYEYIDDVISYRGLGTISCKNTKKNYILILKKIDTINNTSNYFYVPVHNGKGQFVTYDSTYISNINKPNYQFDIISFKTLKDNK